MLFHPDPIIIDQTNRMRMLEAPLLSPTNTSSSTTSLNMVPNPITTIQNHTPASSNHSTSTTTSASNNNGVRKRVRTGCLNCRRKHKKCDETKPICKACQFKHEQCEWPTPKLRKTTSKRLSISSEPFAPNQHQNAEKLTSHQQELSALQLNTNIPIYSRNISNQVNIPKDSSPLDSQNNIIQFPTNTSSNTSFNNNTGFQLHHPTNSQFLSNYESQQPRRISADLSAYSLGGATYNNNNNNNNNGTQFQSQEAACFDTHRPNITMNATNGVPGKLNLNNLLNTHRETSEPEIGYNSSASALKRISDVSSEETQFSNNSRNISSQVFTKTEHTPISTKQPNSNKPSFSQNFDIQAFHNLSATLSQFLKTGSISTNYQNISYQLTELNEVSLLQTYLSEVAPRLDILDTRFYQHVVPQLAKQHLCLRYAIYSTSLFHEKSYDMGLKLYAMSLDTISNGTSGPIEKGICATMLTLISTMVLNATDEWKTSIRDLITFLDAISISTNNDTGEMNLMECYWWAVLMDINSLELGEETSVLFQNQSTYSGENDLSSIIKLLVMVVNLISMDFVDFDQRWEILWNDVHKWYASKHFSLTPILECDGDSLLFPIVKYSSGCFALANQIYHTVMILLIQNKPRLYKTKNVRPITWHAKHIIGTTIHNPSMESWNNSNQSIWIAGKLLTHQDEHKAIENLINDIEFKTGCCFKYKLMDLKNYWDGNTNL